MCEQEVEKRIKGPTVSRVQRKRSDTCEQMPSTYLRLISNPLTVWSVKANMLIYDLDE